MQKFKPVSKALCLLPTQELLVGKANQLRYFDVFNYIYKMKNKMYKTIKGI